jgi:HK97 family phage prohead protease
MPASAPELRTAVFPLQGLEWRDASGTGDGSYTLTGHAAVFGVETELYRGATWSWREVIEPGAFTAVLATNPDVHLNLGHDMNRSIARTNRSGVGGLELAEDEIGLRVFARLDPADPDVQALAAKMSRGIVDQMSFCFRVGSMTTESGVADGVAFEVDHIIEVSDLYDVCACAQAAYPQTDASLRGLQAALRRAGIDPAGIDPRRAPAGETHDRRSTEGGPSEWARQHAALRARLRARIASL